MIHDELIKKQIKEAVALREKPPIRHCCYCSRAILPQDITKEHLIPLSKGGNNTKYNLRDCCKDCNFWRANMSLPSWLRTIQYYLSINKIPVGYNRIVMSDMIVMIIKAIRYIKHNEKLMLKPSGKVICKVQPNTLKFNKAKKKQEHKEKPFKSINGNKKAKKILAHKKEKQQKWIKKLKDE